MSIINTEALMGLNCVLHWPGSVAVSGAYDDDGNKRGFLILPDGVTTTPSGTFTTVKGKDSRTYWVFDGQNNYIEISDSATWDLFAQNFTLCGWFKLSTVVSIYMFSQEYQTSIWYLFYYNNELHLKGQMTGTATFYYKCPFVPVANVWYYITAIRSGSSCIMYINGVSQTVTQTTAFDTGVTNIAGPLLIGRPSEATAMSLKDLMIFKGKALSVDQIQAIMDETYIY